MEFVKLDSKSNSGLSFKETLSVIEGNRTRVRSLCNMVLTSCGMLISSSFVILFFLIRDLRQGKSPAIVALFCSLSMLIIAIYFAIKAVYIREPRPIETDFELVSYQTNCYHKERFLAIRAANLLIAGLIIYFISLILFLIQVNAN